MRQVISGHIKIELPVHHEIIIECKLEVIFISHVVCSGKTSNGN